MAIGRVTDETVRDGERGGVGGRNGLLWAVWRGRGVEEENRGWLAATATASASASSSDSNLVCSPVEPGRECVRRWCRCLARFCSRPFHPPFATLALSLLLSPLSTLPSLRRPASPSTPHPPRTRPPRSARLCPAVLAVYAFHRPLLVNPSPSLALRSPRRFP
ncbi:hypothetical protein BD413DRAFT_17347 [Trametes elegans]|nr:hypothetical protein BD413DRAFT_17347 [Trametes elegans]